MKAKSKVPPHEQKLQILQRSSTVKKFEAAGLQLLHLTVLGNEFDASDNGEVHCIKDFPEAVYSFA